MTSTSQTEPDDSPVTALNDQQTRGLPVVAAEIFLCPHCRRTATNQVKCKGICVADSDY